MMGYSGNSAVQKNAESVIIEAFLKKIGEDTVIVKNACIHGVELDAFIVKNGITYCVEVCAHQGTSKGAQKNKLMNDGCKLILVENLLGIECKKTICVTNQMLFHF